MHGFTPALLFLQVYDETKEDPYADTGGDDVTALTGVKNEYFPKMRDWIKEYVEAFAEKVSWASNTHLWCILRLLLVT